MSHLYGFAGLGQMGGPIAEHISNFAPPLHVYDKAGTVSLAPKSSTICKSLKELALKAETLFLSLPDGTASLSVVKEIASFTKRQTQIIIDLSTIGPDAARAAKNICTKAQLQYIDAPVSGGALGAKNATITIMWAGSYETMVANKKVLEAFSKNQFHIGDHPGQAQSVKILNNFLSGTAMAATSEAILYGLSQGIEMGKMLEVINVSTGQNTASRDKFPQRILTGTFDAGFKTELLAKDIRLYLENARNAGTPKRVSQTISEIWNQCEEALPGSDFTRIYEFIRQNSPQNN